MRAGGSGTVRLNVFSFAKLGLSPLAIEYLPLLGMPVVMRHDITLAVGLQFADAVLDAELRSSCTA